MRKITSPEGSTVSGAPGVVVLDDYSYRVEVGNYSGYHLSFSHDGRQGLTCEILLALVIDQLEKKLSRNEAAPCISVALPKLRDVLVMLASP